MRRLVTKTATIVVQIVQKQSAKATVSFCDALLEYVNDCRAGRAGNSGYERHIQHNGARLEVICSVYPDHRELAREDVSGDGNDALIERLQRARGMAKHMPGGENDTAAGRFAYDPATAAADLRATLDEALAALGVEKEAPAAEPVEE